MPVPPVRITTCTRASAHASRTTRVHVGRLVAHDRGPTTVCPPPVSSSRIDRAAGVGLRRLRVGDREHEAADGRAARWPCAHGWPRLVATSERRLAAASTSRASRSPPYARSRISTRCSTGTLEAAVAQPGLDLQDAAGVGRDHGLAPGGGDVAHLAPQQAVGHLGLRQVVDAGRAAAPVGLRQVHHSQPGTWASSCAGLAADLLAVHDVTGIVIRHRHRHRAQRPAQRLAREELGDVLHGARQSARPARPTPDRPPAARRSAFMCAPQPDVLTTTASAPRRLEGLDRAPGHRHGAARDRRRGR